MPDLFACGAVLKGASSVAGKKECGLAFLKADGKNRSVRIGTNHSADSENFYRGTKKTRPRNRLCETAVPF